VTFYFQKELKKRYHHTKSIKLWKNSHQAYASKERQRFLDIADLAIIQIPRIRGNNKRRRFQAFWQAGLPPHTREQPLARQHLTYP
jgi:hypothetical protein